MMMTQLEIIESPTGVYFHLWRLSMGTVRSIGNSGFWICNQTRNVTADFNAEIHVLRFPFFPFFSFFFFFEIPFDKDLINSSFKEQRFCTCTPGAHNLARIISKKKTRVVQRYFRDSWLAVFIFVNREFKFKFYLNLSVPRKKLRLVIDNRHFITYFSLDF